MIASIDGRLAVHTPENVVFHHELAGPGTRGLAVTLDILIQMLSLVLLGLVAAVLIGIFGSVEDSVTGAQKLAGVIPFGWLIAIGILLVWLIYAGYFILFEAFWRGQTPGKRITRMRVLRDSGDPIGFYEALIRNLLRVIDFLPAWYGIGFISIFITRSEKRIGDLVAGTVVIREKAVSRMDLAELSEEVTPLARELRDLPGLALLTDEEFVLVRDFLERRKGLEVTSRRELGSRLRAYIAFRISYEAHPEPPAEVFLQAVAYQWTARERRGAPPAEEVPPAGE